MKILPFFFILLMACSTAVQESKLVDDFMQERQTYEYAESATYEEAYKGYLKKVEAFYAQEEISKKFPSYLNTLRNQSQILAHNDFNFPSRYRRETGRRAVESSEGYKAYKARFMRYLADKTGREREEKLKLEIGADRLARLKKLHNETISFVHRYTFPY